MRKGKRWLGIILAGAMLVGCLSACGSTETKDNQGQTEQTTQSEEQKAKSDAPESQEEAPGTEGATIRLAHLYDPGTGVESEKRSFEWLEKGIENFEANNPGCTVELEYYKYDEMDTKYMSDYQAGVGHDVLITTSMLFPQHFQVGDLLDMQPYIKEWEQSEVDEFAWNPVWDICSDEGGLYGIPLGLHIRGMIYRKDLFEQAGLDPDSPPKTLDELLAYAQKLNNPDENVYGLGMYLGTERANLECSFYPFLWANGGEIWDAETKEAIFADETGVKTGQFVKDLVTKHGVTPQFAISGGYGDALDAFMNGQYAMMEGFGSYWISNVVEAGMEDKVGICAVPDGSNRFSNCYSLSIYAGSEHPDLAMKLIEELLAPDVITMYADGGLPARQSDYEDEQYQGPLYKAMLEIAEDGRNVAETVNYMKLADSVAAAVQEIIANDGDVKEVFTRYQDEYNARYAGE